MDSAEADDYFNQLLKNIEWKNDEAIMFGKRIITKRKVAWYGSEPFAYMYSRVTKYALPFIPALLALKALAEKVSGETYNSCLLNLYHTGEEGMAWHSDDEAELGHNTVIASLSLGATRKFALRHKHTQEKRELLLQHGQLIVMRGCTQHHWQHAVMKSSKIQEERVSLTFRTYCAHMAEKAAIENGG